MWGEIDILASPSSFWSGDDGPEIQIMITFHRNPLYIIKRELIQEKERKEMNYYFL